MKKFVTNFVAMNPSHCKACWKCIPECPKNVIGKAGFAWHKHVVFTDAEACVGCKKCIKTCPEHVFFVPQEDFKVPNLGQRIRQKFTTKMVLPLSLIGALASGIGLHIAGHREVFHVWHNWAVGHVVVSILAVLSVIFHIVRHRDMLNFSTTKKREKGLSMATLLLFLTVTITGIVLLCFINGANSHVGLWHYGLGIGMMLLCLVHAKN